MKNSFSKIAALIAAGVMALGTVMPTLAEGRAAYTGVTGESINVEKYLVMDTNANVPNVTFNYSIAAGAAQNASGTNARVFAGNDANAVTGAPTIGTATFAAGQQTFATAQDISSTGAQTASGKKDPVTLDANQKYARSDIAVNFSGVTFKEPGIYRWIITESASDTTKGITDDSDNSRVLDVYVIDDPEHAGTLKVNGYVLHNNANDAVVPMEYASGDPTTKTNGFVNTYTSHDLTLSKAVAGNQASRDEYFKFTLNISNAIAGTVYNVDLTNADGTTKTNAINTTAHTNPASLTVGQDGTIRQDYWLQNGQSIVVKGLANNTSYSIAEDKTAMDNEGYTPSVVVTGDNKTTGDANIAFAADTYQISDNAITADTTAAFTNTKSGTIPTGIVMSVLPGAAVVLLGAAGVTIAMKRRKEDEE